MILATTAGDTAAVVLPEATDSSIVSFQGISPPLAGLSFDLFTRGGKLESAVNVAALPAEDSIADCYSWPRARVRTHVPNWRVGFASNRVLAVKVDSIESLPSADSATLAAAITQTAAALPVADPAFRGLPFRVRSAYTFTVDSVDVVIADVVRVVNEEANPRIEHLMIIGERPGASRGKFDAAYYARTAGPEETAQVMDILAVLEIAKTRRPIVVVGIESEDGGRVGLIERVERGRWTLAWRSAYTEC